VKQLKDLLDLVEKAELKITSAYSASEFLVVVIVICVTPAICEEMLFRGFVFRNIERIAKPAIAVFMQSFLFALYHFQPLNLVPLIMLGLFLGYVVYCSGSIYTSMVCHFLNNFLASYMVYKYGKEDFETPHLSSSGTLDAVLIVLCSLVLLSIVIILMYRLRYRKEETASL